MAEASEILTPRGQEIKYCAKCNSVKIWIPRRKDSPQGKGQYKCRPCTLQKLRDYGKAHPEIDRARRIRDKEKRRLQRIACYQKNREKMLANAKAKHAKNREHSNAYSREYRKKNLEACKAMEAKWRERNPEKLKAKQELRHARPGYRELAKQKSREWRLLHPERVLATRRARKQAHAIWYAEWLKTPMGKRAALRNHQKRRALKKQAVVRITALEFHALQDAATHCSYCGRPRGDKRLALDHIVPLFKKGPHCASNLLPACKTCNSSKRDLLPHEWAARTGIHIFPMPLPLSQ